MTSLLAITFSHYCVWCLVVVVFFVGSTSQVTQAWTTTTTPTTTTVARKKSRHVLDATTTTTTTASTTTTSNIRPQEIAPVMVPPPPNDYYNDYNDNVASYDDDDDDDYIYENNHVNVYNDEYYNDAWSPQRRRKFGVSDLLPFPRFSKNLVEKNHVNNNWSPRRRRQQQQQQQQQQQRHEEPVGDPWSPRGGPEFANPYGKRRYNPSSPISSLFRSQAYRDQNANYWNNNNNNNNKVNNNKNWWSPRSSASVPLFANPRGLRRYGSSSSNNYNYNKKRSSVWNPRMHASSRGWYNDYDYDYDYYYNDNFRLVSGNAREYFAMDTTRSAPGNCIVLEAPDDRPLQADVQIYEGSNNVPVRFQVYSENGRTTPFCAIVGNNNNNKMKDKTRKPFWSSFSSRAKSVSIRNTASLEFPLAAQVQPTWDTPALYGGYNNNNNNNNMPARTSDGTNSGTDIQGNSRRTWTLHPSMYCGKVVVTLTSQGLPVDALVELWGANNHVLQSIQVQQQDGHEYASSIVLDTTQALQRGQSVVVAIRNRGSMTFPITATVLPYHDGGGQEGRINLGRKYERQGAYSYDIVPERNYNYLNGRSRSNNNYYYDSEYTGDRYSSAPSYRRSMHPETTSAWG